MAYTPNNPNGQATSANSAPVVIASDQTAIPTTVTAALPVGANLIGAVTRAGTQVDVHGQTLGVSRVVQITAKFFQQPPSSFLNITTSGGATATGPTAGTAVFATGTATTASLIAQTPTTVMYATQFEAWASMAGAFTAPTSAATFQRLGIYDAINGYFFGYSGLTFGLTARASSADSFIGKASWNIDTLTGAAGSKFTSGGTPVALVPTNMNMWRMRYGWYGGVTARYEVYSPDGEWVLVHQVRVVNAQPGVNITAPDLPMTLEVSKTAADATNLIITCGGWGAGITSASSGTSLSGQGSIAALNALVGVPLTGVGALSFSVTGTWVGTLSFQYSLDGLAWTADSVLNNVTGLFPSFVTVNGAFTATVGSYKFYRIVATAWMSGSASVVYNASPIASMVVSQSIITDGLGTGPVAVKAPSAAAVANDPALVVALSPNSPTPAGANTIGKVGIDQTTQGVTNAVAVTSQPEVVVTGTITTTDIVVAAPTGNGALLSGTSTAGSYVAALATGGNASVVIGITGLTSGTLYYEGSADSTTGTDGNWVPLNMKQSGITNTQISSSATSNGLYRGNTAGIRYIRMRSVGALVGTPAVTLRLSSGVAGEFLFGSIPTGTNTIGASNINTANVSATTALHTANVTVGLSVGANLPITGYGTSVIKITGTFVASFTFKVSQDAGVSWDNISGTQVGGGDIFTTATLAGSYRFTVTGFDLLRVEVTLTSGSITINGKSSNAVNASKIVKLATGGLVIGAVKITDGTNTPSVKPASTAPLATDPALVVTDRGNPSGVSVLGGRWLVSDGFNAGVVDPNTFNSTGNPIAPVFGTTSVDLSMTVTTASAIKALETVSLFTPVPGGTLGAFVRYQAASSAATTFTFAGFYDVSVAGAQPAFGAFVRTYSGTYEAVVRTQDRSGAIVESYVNVASFFSVNSGLHIAITDSVVTFTINRQIAARIQIDASTALTLPTMKVGVYSTNIGTGLLNTAFVDYIGVYNTGMNGQISDPIYPTRMAMVSATGALKVGIDPVNLGSQVSATALPVTQAPDQFLVQDTSTNKELLTQILIELRIQTMIQYSTLQPRDDLDALRQDAQSTIYST